jgi:glutamyl-tRNA synthetase
MTTTRFAPSPTGFLHIGNLRTALINFLIAKKNNGTFILRLDDTDPIRSKKMYADQIKWDLEWLGLGWDRIETQSSRKDRYENIASELKENGRLYEAFETPTELDLKRKKQLNKGQPPVYDRSALKLTTDAIKKLRQTEPGYWRFLLNHERIFWEDGILGPISIDAKSVSDPVLIRKDGQFLYTLASVVDDVDMGITHVVRGADHVTNTGTQIQIMEAMGRKSPHFSHHSLLTGPNGEALSKRLGTLALKDLKSNRIEPMAVLSHLARIGTSNTVDLRVTIEELIDDFDLTSFGSSPTRIDLDNLNHLSVRYLKMLPYEVIKHELDTLRVDKEIQVAFWEMAKNNINSRTDISKWWKICSEGVKAGYSNHDKNYISLAFEDLPMPPFNESTWANWTEKVKEKTGRSGKNLYMPLRNALTGLDHGPDMSTLMPLLMKVNRP